MHDEEVTLTTMSSLPWNQMPILRDTKTTILEPYLKEGFDPKSISDEGLRRSVRFNLGLYQWAVLDDHGNALFYLTDDAKKRMYAMQSDDPPCGKPIMGHQFMRAEKPMSLNQSITSRHAIHAQEGDIIIRSIRENRDGYWEYFYYVAPHERIADFKYDPKLEHNFHRLVGTTQSLVTASDGRGIFPRDKYDFRREEMKPQRY